MGLIILKQNKNKNIHKYFHVYEYIYFYLIERIENLCLHINNVKCLWLFAYLNANF